MNKTYIIDVRGAYKSDDRKVEVVASSLDDAAALFAKMKMTGVMNAFVSLKGGVRSYSVQSYSSYWAARRQAVPA
jgi:hypothetical protein